MITIETKAAEEMFRDGINSFPDECCGFFYGSEDSNGDRNVSEVLLVNNSKDGDKRRRFEISSKDYLKAEQHAFEKDLLLLGVYHSHPNHPPIPSEHDRVAAQPYFSYIILSVFPGEVRETRSWRLNDEFQFEEEKVNESIKEII